MTHTNTWEALSARIRGLIDASHLASHLLPTNLDASPGLLVLRKHAADILVDLEAYGLAIGSSSPNVATAIMTLFGTASPHLNDPNQTTASRLNSIRSALVILAAGEAEISYLLRDRQAAILSRSERALLHLKRSIVINVDMRKQWISAFAKGEVSCEQLGAIHLLAHGIWAFKVHADGGRTDLVYQEPLNDLPSVSRTADGLVLTEWKKLRSGGDSERSFDDARHQSDGYASGVLSGTELTSYRFAIVVSQYQVPVPDDLQVGDITYRHVNIAVDPRTPSKAARERRPKVR